VEAMTLVDEVAGAVMARQCDPGAVYSQH